MGVREVLDAAAVRHWCRLAVDALGRTRAEIDALNVFPVPDGDTGTNLHLTVLAAAEALDELPAAADEPTTWRTLAHGALLGARGNSGVILSQVLRGLAEVLGQNGRPDGHALRDALQHASALAHGSVAHPVEGTVLSVLRAAGDACAAGEDLVEVARLAAEGARAALRRTTGQLDVLARNGVVDAGGAGLCVIFDTLAAVVSEEYPDRYDIPGRLRDRPAPARVPADGDASRAEPLDGGGYGGGYEVMFLLDAPDDAIPALRTELDALGDSLVVVGGDGLWNVHVHADAAGAAIEAGLAAGRPHRIRVTYLRAEPDRHARCTGRGVVAVVIGAGLTALFESVGAAVVPREPGRAPPLAALLEAILAAGDEVVVLPNDQATLAVAEGAAQRARSEGVRVSVIPTRASVQGLAAIAVHDPLRRFDEDVIAMTSAAGATRYGQLEVAIEEAVTSAGICRPGDVLGLIEGDVVVIGSDLADVAVEILDRMLAGGGELVTLISGAAVDQRFVEEIDGRLHGRRPDVEVAGYQGGQERYPLLIGVE